MKITDAAKTHQLTVYLPDSRGVSISPFGVGNLKLGLGVHTFSRLPGSPDKWALGLTPKQDDRDPASLNGTCPGATEECQKICYAKRPVTEDGPVYELWRRNSQTEDVPMELPPGCTLLRLHISGDFSTRAYIDGWYALLIGRPDVKVWCYTRSWRVPALLPALERLRALPHVQMFASVDSSTPNEEVEAISNASWRLAWIDGDYRGNNTYETSNPWRTTRYEGRSFVCPEETGAQPNCVACRYCFDGKKFDVTFLKH